MLSPVVSFYGKAQILPCLDLDLSKLYIKRMQQSVV